MKTTADLHHQASTRLDPRPIDIPPQALRLQKHLESRAFLFSLHHEIAGLDDAVRQ
jgi:hypothetical protein